MEWQDNPIAAQDETNELVMVHQAPLVGFLPPFDRDTATVSSTIPGLSVQIYMDQTVFIANQEVTGYLFIDCKRQDCLKIGKINVHVVGMEGIRKLTRTLSLNRNRNLLKVKTSSYHVLASLYLSPEHSFSALGSCCSW